MVTNSTNETLSSSHPSKSEAPPSSSLPPDIDPKIAEFESAFDLPTSSGDTESERFLADLCQRSFLRLWSYPNTFTDEGLREGKASSGNEFTDVLIVFGDDVILFSDKDIKFHNDKSIEIAWPRWFKNAVEKSANQLFGALNWAKRFPTRIFLDAKCTRPLPTKLPTPNNARYHLVATTRGSTSSCANHLKGSKGTHKIDSSVNGSEHKNHPFTIGLIDPNKHFIHIFDELSLELLLRELDTAHDFISYLRARQELLTNSATTIRSAGEEQLLAAYMSNMRGAEHWFFPSSLSRKAPDIVLFDESHWPAYKKNPQYIAKKIADQTSYLWDALLDRFIKIGHPKFMESSATQEEHEAGLRLIASTGRFERRYLSDAFRGVRNDAFPQPMARRTRMFTTIQNPEIGYVFLIFPKLAEWDYQSYRRARAACLKTYLICAKLRLRDANTFIGIAIDHPAKTYLDSSEDIGIHRYPEDEEIDWGNLRRIADAANIIDEAAPIRKVRVDDFPRPLSPNPSPKKNNSKPKRNKTQRKARRKNRK